MSFTTALFEALSDVAERNFFAFADAEVDAFPDLVEAAPGWIVAAVRFDGAPSGVLSAALPGALARELYASFTGADGDEEPAAAALDDLLGEFANMVCGAWLSRQGGTRTFALGRPTVLRTRDEWRPTWSVPAGAVLPLTINGYPVAVAIVGRED